MSTPIDADLIVKVAEAKTRLSELIQRAEGGERVVIARGNEPAVVLQPVRPAESPIGILQRMGVDVDLDELHRQIDEPWTEEELDEFEGDLEEELKRA